MITIGTLTLSNGYNNPDFAIQKIGTRKYIVTGIKLTAGSIEDVRVNKIIFTQVGTIDDGDVSDLELLVDDQVIAGQSALNDGKAIFNLSSNPVVVKRGEYLKIYLRLDIVGGSGKTIKFSIDDESDIEAVGLLYNKEIKITAGTGATANKNPFWVSPITKIKLPLHQQWWFPYILPFIVAIATILSLYFIIRKN